MIVLSGALCSFPGISGSLPCFPWNAFRSTSSYQIKDLPPIASAEAILEEPRLRISA
jgi:hypothetical protein